MNTLQHSLTADDLKTRRNTAKFQFTISEWRLKEAIDNIENIPIALVVLRLDELATRWNGVQDTHDAYVAALPPPLQADGQPARIDNLRKHVAHVGKPSKN